MRADEGWQQELCVESTDVKFRGAGANAVLLWMVGGWCVGRVRAGVCVAVVSLML
jgi:hypothetical protein